MSDGRTEDEADPSENGRSAADESVEERTVETTVESGQSTGGQSTGGQSTGGQSTGGQSTGGQSTGGQPADGQSSDGQSTGGQSTGGQSTGGQSTGGQSAGGQSTGGQSAGGQSTGGQSTGGQSAGQTGGQSPGQRSGQAGQRTAGQNAGSAGRGAQPSDSMTGPAAGGTDLEPNVAAAIAYVFAPLTGVLMLLLEGDDDFVRFHSIQSIGFGAAAIGAYVVVGIVMGVLTAIPFVGDLFLALTMPLNGAVGLIAFAGWVLLLLKAYQGERYGLPVLGPIAASN
ncbi:hypothetical protein ACFQMA_16570 [Halosimplex aquaticum]|uniref:DUF4870 domain-containing protein n=1 Tax=Halosimplex aquaticum TaxID=3026162 RepID=A0ABD5Y6N1_9EURY|nr:hypothetical protein [Halosimplex aquaticum]